jgi:hypothetical protein
MKKVTGTGAMRAGAVGGQGIHQSPSDFTTDKKGG